MRAFIAIDLPTEIKTKITEITGKLKNLPLKAKWVSFENLHITLKFLGNISPETLEKIKSILDGLSKKYPPFSLKLNDFGFFPNSRKPRIFFVSFSAEKILENIIQDLNKELKEIGFGQDKKFRAHATLARIKSLKNIKQLTGKIEAAKAEGNFKVKNLSLYKSILSQKSAVYEEIFKASLSN